MRACAPKGQKWQVERIGFWLQVQQVMVTSAAKACAG